MRPLRPLLPAKRGHETPQPAHREAPPPKPLPVATSASKKRNTLACDSCRAKRVKCDGARSACDACSQRDLACHYSERETRCSKGKEKEHVEGEQESACEQFVALVKGGSEERAVAVVRSLRAGTAIEAIVSQCELGDGSSDGGSMPGDGEGEAHGQRTAAASLTEDIHAALQRDYDVLAKQANTLQETLDLFRCMPENDAQRLLHDLRYPPASASVLRAPFLTTPENPRPEKVNARSLSPSPHAHLDRELVALYPKAFPAVERAQKSGLVAGVAGARADAIAQDPWTEDPVNVWELPGDGT